MPYRKTRRRKTKPKEPGKFEIGAFGVLLGFAVGLTCGLFMGGLSKPTRDKAVAKEEQRHRPLSESAAEREAKLRASMERLKSSGKNVEALEERFRRGGPEN